MSWETVKIMPVASLSDLFSCVWAPSPCDSDAKFLKRCSLSLSLLEIDQLQLLSVEDALHFPWQDGKTHFPRRRSGNCKWSLLYIKEGWKLQNERKAYAKGIREQISAVCCNINWNCIMQLSFAIIFLTYTFLSLDINIDEKKSHFSNSHFNFLS